MNNKKLFKGALVLFASIFMAVSCSNPNTPESKKTWTGPTLPADGKPNQLLAVDVLSTGNIPVSIPVTVDTAVQGVSFAFESAIEVDESGNDKTDANAAKLGAADIVSGSQYEGGKLSLAIKSDKKDTIASKKMKLTFKVTSTSHEDKPLNVYVNFSAEKTAVGKDKLLDAVKKFATHIDVDSKGTGTSVTWDLSDATFSTGTTVTVDGANGGTAPTAGSDKDKIKRSDLLAKVKEEVTKIQSVSGIKNAEANDVKEVTGQSDTKKYIVNLQLQLADTNHAWAADANGGLVTIEFTLNAKLGDASNVDVTFVES